MIEKRTDYKLLALFAIWIVFGLIMLASASSPYAHEKYGDAYILIKKQIYLGFLPGLVLFIFFAKLDYHLLKKWSTWIYLGAVLLLLLVFIPGIGANYDTNAKSWLKIFGHSFQPAEFAKLALIIYISAILAKIGRDIVDFKSGFVFTLVLGFIPIGLVLLQPDVGTVSILFTILFALLFTAGARWSHIIGLSMAGVAVLIVMVLIAPYRADRLMIFLHPELDPLGTGYHTSQAVLAIGTGGLLGKGLGHSVQKYQYLPEVHSDSIFAVLAEEMGLFVSVGFIILLLLIVIRSFKLARNTNDEFGRLLVAGIVVWFSVQTFLNIGAIVGILPLTGVPLPFMSAGGTALLIGMASVGILANVSKQTL